MNTLKPSFHKVILIIQKCCIRIEEWLQKCWANRSVQHGNLIHLNFHFYFKTLCSCALFSSSSLCCNFWQILLTFPIAYFKWKLSTNIRFCALAVDLVHCSALLRWCYYAADHNVSLHQLQNAKRNARTKMNKTNLTHQQLWNFSWFLFCPQYSQLRLTICESRKKYIYHKIELYGITHVP